MTKLPPIATIVNRHAASDVLPPYTESVAVDPNEILKKDIKKEIEESDEDSEEAIYIPTMVNNYNNNNDDVGGGRSDSYSDLSHFSSSSSEGSMASPPLEIMKAEPVDEAIYGPSPSNRNLLEKLCVPPPLMSTTTQHDDGLHLNEQDFNSIKMIVEQTFKDGRDLMDIISTV